jgi:hypothetical protein
MSSEEDVFRRHERERQAWMQAQSRLAAERTQQLLRKTLDQAENGSTLFGLPSTSWSIAGAGAARQPGQPTGFYLDDSKYAGHSAGIYQPTFAQQLWYEALARSQRTDNRSLPQQYSTSQLGEGFSQMDIRERAKRRVNGARW